MPLFWLNYRDPNGRAAGVVVMQAEALVAARMKAAVAGLDQGLDFTAGNQLDGASARQIPDNVIGGLLDDGDLRRLQRIVVPKKPSARPIRQRPAARRSAKR